MIKMMPFSLIKKSCVEKEKNNEAKCVLCACTQIAQDFQSVICSLWHLTSYGREYEVDPFRRRTSPTLLYVISGHNPTYCDARTIVVEYMRENK